MDLLKTRLSDFKPIDLAERKEEFNDAQYLELKKLLQRLSKSEQKASQAVEILKDEVDKTLSKNRELAEQVYQDKIQVDEDNKLYEKTLIKYFDMIDRLEEVVNQIENKEFKTAVVAVVKEKNEINSKIGMQEIPGKGTKLDPEVHYVRDKEITDKQEFQGTIKEVIRKGYRRGIKVLRKADVIVYTEK